MGTRLDRPCLLLGMVMNRTLVRERSPCITNVDERLGEVRADERKIRQVVLNLLSNGIKFTPEAERVEVAAVPRAGWWRYP